VTYDANSRALSATAKNVLSALAKKLVKGGSVTVVGYAHDDATLARKRAEVVARYLAAKVAVHVSIKIVTTSTVNKVMVITTRQ
jgi:outer membrane protein OmpA-like peptidoglycan-associated protein